MTVFQNRHEAGQQLAVALSDYAGRSDLLILGLPRGGVPVAYEVALQLDAELDIMVVRKLGCPGQEELAMGAIASGGIRVVNDLPWISQSDLDRVTQTEQAELKRRETAYRGNRPYPALEDRCVILVDDGLATGATMRAAVAAVRQKNPASLVVAIPVAPANAVQDLQREADEVVCLSVPAYFGSVGQFYENFSQTSDATVTRLLQQAWDRKQQTAQQ
jgi:putative phosphoribosyl transferase